MSKDTRDIGQAQLQAQHQAQQLQAQLARDQVGLSGQFQGTGLAGNQAHSPSRFEIEIVRFVGKRYIPELGHIEFLDMTKEFVRRYVTSTHVDRDLRALYIRVKTREGKERRYTIPFEHIDQIEESLVG